MPGLNLAAMPDLIFTVLFFFMIVTHMRDVKPMVRYEVPQGTELEKTVRKSSVVYLFIGKPVDAQGRMVDGETPTFFFLRYFYFTIYIQKKQDFSCFLCHTFLLPDIP